MYPLKLLHPLMQTSCDFGLTPRLTLALVTDHGMRIGHISALKQLLDFHLQTSKMPPGCWSPAIASSRCPCLASASGPHSVRSHLHCSIKHASFTSQAWRPSSTACFASVHLNSLPFSLPFPSSNKIASPKLLGTRAGLCYAQSAWGAGRALSVMG